ncbi:MAG TPA: hypothetical protein VGZ93_00610 [Candidatus Methylacidiphilales bacterium]|jgi:signal transduction histidine kinase|nr:hypothetical protein [Candidatus Methylacidiphilales bacterium]
MALSPDMEARGMRAYEQARAYERLRSWRLPLSFVVFALIPAVGGAWMWATGHTVMAWLYFFAAIFLAWAGWFQWRQLGARHARNLRLLAELKAEYGDELPWVRVENHFAELEKLRREMAEESERGLPR